jgi:hypothetical protein
MLFKVSALFKEFGLKDFEREASSPLLGVLVPCLRGSWCKREASKFGIWVIHH